MFGFVHNRFRKGEIVRKKRAKPADFVERKKFSHFTCAFYMTERRILYNVKKDFLFYRKGGFTYG